MNKPDSNDPIPNVAAELEQKLDAARKAKVLAQVPALRRLHMVVRVYVIFGTLVQIFVIPLGLVLRYIHNTIDQAGLGVSSFLAFMLYAVIMWISMATGWLLLCAYARFRKQFRRNHVRDIEDTTAMILRLFRYNLLFVILGTLVFPIAMFQNAKAALTSAFTGLVPMIVTIVMYFIVRRYVTTAQAELPSLVAAAGDNAPRGTYHAWKPLFLKLLTIALIALGLGYLLGGAMEGRSDTHLSFDQTLARIASETNKTLPIMVDSETRLDSMMPGPGKKFTYFFTLINYSKGDLNTSVLQQTLRPQLVANYQSNDKMQQFREYNMELHYHYKDKNGESLFELVVTPSDF